MYNHICFSEFSGFEFAGFVAVGGWRLVARLKVLVPRNFNNVIATSCCKMASMNAWRDGDEVALRLLGTPP
ncbi:hypothetical protein E2C01_102331 [Portunus trituberculatus]|uniref:Uncharacterized protein n=1 Tax=Portunus trituberculatus TaxID=210409 RepID=A0A5B7KIA1_PORTR|nr:hypothetical protein [Portunus trituberculatus]